MITTLAEARRIIARNYGDQFHCRITSRSVTIGVRPLSDPRPTLAWFRLSPGQDSAVKIGVVPVVNGELSDIDWSWGERADLPLGP